MSIVRWNPKGMRGFGCDLFWSWCADRAKTSARMDHPHFREMAFMTHSTTQVVANGRGTWCWKSRFSTGGVTLRTEFTSPSTRYRLVGRGR